MVIDCVLAFPIPPPIDPKIGRQSSEFWNFLKGLSREMDLAFDDMHGLGLNGERSQFLNFLGASVIFIMQKVYFSRLKI